MAEHAAPAEIAKARRLWEANVLPISSICRAVGYSPPWLYHHMRKAGWAERKGKPPAAAKPKAKAFYRGRNAWGAVERAEIAARELKIYPGRLLADVQLLRRRGFAVNCEGDRYRVGNALVDAKELQAKAARERRLLNGGCG